MTELTMLGVVCVGLGCYALWLDAQLDRANLVIKMAHEVISSVADGKVEIQRVGKEIKVKEVKRGAASQSTN